MHKATFVEVAHTHTHETLPSLHLTPPLVHQAGKVGGTAGEHINSVYSNYSFHFPEKILNLGNILCLSVTLMVK